MVSGSEGLHKEVLAISPAVVGVVLALDHDRNRLIAVDAGVGIREGGTDVLDIATEDGLEVALEPSHADLEADARLLVEDAGVLRETERSAVEGAGLVGLVRIVDELVAEHDLGARNLLAVRQLVLAGTHVHAGHEHVVLTLGGPPTAGTHAVVGLCLREGVVERVEHGLDVVLNGHLILRREG